MEKPLNQQVVFITGAASGIGLACAYRFAQEGAAVIGFDISEGEQWQQVSDITDKQQLITGDVMSLEQQQAAVQHAVDRYGACLLYTSPSPRDRQKSRMPSSA